MNVSHLQQGVWFLRHVHTAALTASSEQLEHTAYKSRTALRGPDPPIYKEGYPPSDGYDCLRRPRPQQIPGEDRLGFEEARRLGRASRRRCGSVSPGSSDLTFMGCGSQNRSPTARDGIPHDRP